MPWKEVLPMRERMRFVVEAEQSDESLAMLCRKYGISRKTGYKWLRRYEEFALDGLYDRPRNPQLRPNETHREMVDLVLSERDRRPHWGPKKLAAFIAREYGCKPPAPSTIGKILTRHGRVKRRKLRKKASIRGWPGSLTPPEHPNHVWAADFKGWFRAGDGSPCHPLTISDLSSRYVLCCDILQSNRHDLVLPSFHRTFMEFGLPRIIRVDNGAPFGTCAPMGLSKLSVMWLRLGITVEYISPGKPQQNGSHERMHRTLKMETACPPAAEFNAQQRRMDKWRSEFNEQRPHEALGQKTPSFLYCKSSRKWDGELPQFVYPPHFEQRRVKTNATIQWKRKLIYVGESFKGCRLGLTQNDQQMWLVYAGNMLIGMIADRRGGGLTPLPGRAAGRH
jgi:transposase InsO family protein